MAKRSAEVDRADRLAAENTLLRNAMAAGGDHALLRCALRVINRAGLVDSYVDELMARPGRTAIAADFGLNE